MRILKLEALEAKVVFINLNAGLQGRGWQPDQLEKIAGPILDQIEEKALKTSDNNFDFRQCKIEMNEDQLASIRQCFDGGHFMGVDRKLISGIKRKFQDVPALEIPKK